MNGLPLILYQIPVGPCLGYGVVQSIDMVEKVFYVMTPTPPEDLQKVNTLLQAKLDYPTVPVRMKLLSFCVVTLSR